MHRCAPMLLSIVGMTRCCACAARVHVFRVLISSMLAIVTVLLMDMANTQFYAYYMCAPAPCLC